MNGIRNRNPSGYLDPTAHDALQRVQNQQDETDRRTYRLIAAVKTMLDECGYDVLTRIEVRHRATGRIYR